MAWYNSNWGYRVKLTVDSSKVGSDLTDFPIFIDLSEMPSDFWTHVKTDGADIRITKSDQTTEVAREVVGLSTGTSTGEVHFTTDGTLSSSSDTDFYIYYGNASASDYARTATYGADNVWDSNYGLVAHMTEDPSGTAPQMLNSAGGGLDNGTSSGSMTSGDLVAAEVYKGLEFDGSNDYIDHGDPSTFFNSVTQLSATIVAKRDNLSGLDVPLTNKTSGGSNTNKIIITSIGTTGKMVIETGGSSVKFGRTATGISTGTWYCFGFNGTTNDTSAVEIYFNGVSQTLEAGASINVGSLTLDQTMRAGGGEANSRYWDGNISEVRLSKIVRDADWLAAEYESLLNPDTFMTYSAEEAQSGTSFTPRSILIE